MTANASRLRSLYVSYLGLSDPLVQTQVVAYLEGLAQRGHTVHLLTFEPARLSRARRRELRSQLSARGIAWNGLRYHKRPSLPATLFDIAVGTIMCAYLVRHHRLEAIHARSHVPAAMALLARPLARFALIFDIRGLMAEEYEDAGRWRRGSAPWRLAKLVERKAITAAVAIIVLTERARRLLFPGGDPRVHVIPCCADVEQIERGRVRRDEIRRELGIEDRLVLVYLGKFTGWYMEREMVEFFELARRVLPGLYFLILTQSDVTPIVDELGRAGIGGQDYTITSVPPAAVGGYLAAADAAISFIRPSFSKLSSSPTKVGEYLAAGLPIVTGRGIGDVDSLLSQFRVGILLEGFGEAQMRSAADALGQVVHDPEYAERSRQAARERLSLTGIGIPAYDGVLASVAMNGVART